MNIQYSSDIPSHGQFRVWMTLVLLMVFNAVSVLDRNIVSLVLVDIGAELHLSDFQLSLIHGAAFAIFYGVGGLLLGSLIDRYPRKLIIYASITCWSLATAACGLARSYVELIIARGIVGAGEGGVGPASQSLTATLFDRTRVGFPMSLLIASSSMGMGLSFIGGGILLEHLSVHSAPGLNDLAPWRQLLLITGLPGALIAFAAFLLIEPDRTKKADPAMVATWADFFSFVWTKRALVFGLLGGYGLCSVITYGSLSWTPTYARRVLGMSPSEIGWLLGLIAIIGGPLSMSIYGAIMDRQAARGNVDFPLRAFVGGIFLAIPLGSAGFLLNEPMALIMAILVIQCILLSAFGPAAAVIQLITPPTMRGRMAALMVAVFSLSAYAVGPVSVSMLTSFLFKDVNRVGSSIALVFVVVGPLSALCIWKARASYIREFAQSSPGSTGGAPAPSRT